MTGDDRRKIKARIIFKYSEMLTKEEASNMRFWHSMVFFSGMFFVMLQVPYSFKYALMIRKDLNANRHLIRRIIWINAFNIPLWIQGNSRSNKLIN